MIERYVEAASTYASEIDDLVLLITVLVGFWFVVCELVFFWMIFRFRAVKGRRTEYVTGEEKEVMVRQARLDGILNVKEDYPERSLGPDETVNGRACYAVVLTSNSGRAETWLVDQEDWRLRRKKFVSIRERSFHRVNRGWIVALRACLRSGCYIGCASGMFERQTEWITLLPTRDLLPSVSGKPIGEKRP